MTAVIEVNDLTKDYGSGRGIFDVSFQVEQGEVFGFLGPNGTGKTTAIRHLMGFLNPGKGQASINGLVCNQHMATILKDVGYLPGEIELPAGLTGSEFIQMMRGLRGISDTRNADELLDTFQLDPSGKTKRMSAGEKRKLALVTAFMGDPEILLLDEPTSGLDPLMQQTFIDFLLAEKQRGRTILLSSHMFSEVDSVCDRVAIIKDGMIVSTVKVTDIRHSRHKTYEVQFASEPESASFLREREFDSAAAGPCTVKVSIDDALISTLLRVLDTYQVASLREIKYTLEDYFLHFYAAPVEVSA